jgi:Leucine Rich Repeat.
MKKLLNLKELFLAHNRIMDLSSLSFCENLRILDVGYNKIQNFQAINGLESIKSLKIVNFEGNLVTKQNGFRENLQALVPSINKLNPKNFRK